MEQFNALMNQPNFFIAVMIWSFLWKGLALWKSANKRHLLWFVIMLVVNTLGLLEIAYFFFLNRWDIDGGRILKLLENRVKKNNNHGKGSNRI